MDSKQIVDSLVSIFKNSQFRSFLEKKTIPFILESVYKSNTFKKKEIERNRRDALMLDAIAKLTAEIKNLNENLINQKENGDEQNS